MLQKNGLRGAYAKRCEFDDLESVQLYAGQEDGLSVMKHGTDGTSTIVVEVGATLGYSLGVSGEVLGETRMGFLMPGPDLNGIGAEPRGEP